MSKCQSKVSPFEEKPVPPRIAAVRAEIQVRKQKNDHIFQLLVEKTSGCLSGLELQKVSREGYLQEEWAILLPDASEPGRFRYQRYDEDGFFSHSTFDSQEEALKSAIAEGYSKTAPGSLDRVSDTDRWKKGMANAFAVQKSWSQKSILSDVESG